jgi:epoxyqueuosine reductase
LLLALDNTFEVCRSASDLAQLSTGVKEKARLLGLGPTGITSALPSARLMNYEKWLANEYHGELGYMARPDRVARRRDPQIILPGAAAVVMTSIFYWPGKSGFPASHSVQRLSQRSSVALKDAKEVVCPETMSRGIVSSYAWGADYHALLESKLRTLGTWLHEQAGGMGRYYVDTGAVLERDFAERAGLGFIGKNSLLINPTAGSGFFIGGLFTTVPLHLDGDESHDFSPPKQRGRPGCGKCTKCKVACPTGAIVSDRVVDARKCISYLTIELKGPIPESLRPHIGNRIYGCDICQQVCPWNKIDWNLPAALSAQEANADSGGKKGALLRPPLDHGTSPLFGSPGADVTSPRLVELLWATKRSFRTRFKGTALERIGRDRLARNAAVALGNVGGAHEIGPVGAAAIAHPSPLVREHAAWAFERIKSRT